MSNNSDTQKAEATDATAGVDPNLGKVVKAFFVGCNNIMVPVFAEALTGDDGALRIPRMDDSRDGLRFVRRDGQEENANYIPTVTTCYPGAMVEIKKYLYDVGVIWAPKNIDKGLLTRERDGKGPVEEALETFFHNHGSQAQLIIAEALRRSQQS